jgi:hypothetical protein
MTARTIIDGVADESVIALHQVTINLSRHDAHLAIAVPSKSQTVVT